MTKLRAATVAVFFATCSEVAISGEAPSPSQLTSRGNIAWQATEEYKQAIDACYGGKPGDAPRGPRFLSCLKQLLSSEAATLNAVYAGTLGYLKSSASQSGKLRQSQRDWLKFQVSNCSFTKAVSGPSSDESYFDCMLRSTIDRRVELRSLVGD
jgi:uncharacterized protein YecT (DUF1311 family)